MFMGMLKNVYFRVFVDGQTGYFDERFNENYIISLLGTLSTNDINMNVRIIAYILVTKV